MHVHEDTMEAMLCIQGKAHAKIDGEWVQFVPGSMIVADKMEEQCIVNDGDFCVPSVFTPLLLRQRLFVLEHLPLWRKHRRSKRSEASLLFCHRKFLDTWDELVWVMRQTNFDSSHSCSRKIV